MFVLITFKTATAIYHHLWLWFVNNPLGTEMGGGRREEGGREEGREV